MILTTFIAAAALAGTGAPRTTPARASNVAPARLEVAFAKLAQPRGQIMLALFDSEASYKANKPVRSAAVPVDAARVFTLLEGLAPGRYAIKLFHDVDGDGKMGTNPFGLPIEPYAFSNDATGTTGPASWADAAFDVAAGANDHVITFR